MDSIADGYCQCGCGEMTSVFRKKPRRFIAGHQARGANNSRFGVRLTDDTKKKISIGNKGKQAGENNPFYGKKHTAEALKLMSEKAKGIARTPRRGINKACLFCGELYYVNQYKKDTSIYCSNECRNKDYVTRLSGTNNPFYGKTHSEETKNIIRAATVKQRSMAPVLPTKPEMAMHEELRKRNLAFETEKLINDKFCVDIYLPEYKLIIFVDGCYWHACPTHCPNAKKPKSDNARIPYLTKCGYSVEIIWEHDIKAGTERIVQSLCQKYNLPMIKKS